MAVTHKSHGTSFNKLLWVAPHAIPVRPGENLLLDYSTMLAAIAFSGLVARFQNVWPTISSLLD
jgi:hypothetical protein